MLISRKKRVIVLRLKEPERVLSVIPKAKKFTFKGKEYVAVPHRRDEVKVLNNIGIEAPSPMLYYYDWPGRFKPFEAQRTTAAFMSGHNRCFNLNDLGCVDSETEYLSPTGWVKISEYVGGKVAQYHPVTERIEFVEPDKYVKLPCETMFRIKTKYGLDQMLSPEHRVLLAAKGNPNKLEVVNAETLFIRQQLWLNTGKNRKSRETIGWSKAAIPVVYGAPGGEGLPLTDAQLRVQIAVIADGHFPPNNTTRCTVRLKKPRKIERLRKLLTDASIECYERPDNSVAGFVKFSFDAPIRVKEFDEQFWSASNEQLAVVRDEVIHWDGSFREGKTTREFISNSKASADFVQYAFNAGGFTSRVVVDSRGPTYSVLIRDNGHPLQLVSSGKNGRNAVMRPVASTDGFKYCFMVPSTFLLFRRNGCVFASGNTGKTMATLWAYDYLRSIGVVHKVLVVSPLSTLERAWCDEVFNHFPHLTTAVLHGSRDKRLKMLNTEADIYVINHDGLKVSGMVDELNKRNDIDLVIIDEVSQAARTASSDRWKSLAKVVRHEIAKGVQRMAWGLTGTPVPNNPTDAWAQCRLIVPERVPPYFNSFKGQVMRQVGQFSWVPRQEAQGIVFEAMQPAIRFKRDEVVDLPECTYIERTVDLTAAQKKAYKDMLNKLQTEFESGEVTAVNEAVKAQKLIQILCGAVFGKNGEVHLVDSKPRYETIREVCEESGSKTIVFVPFVPMVKPVAEYLAKAGFTAACIYGDVSKHDRDVIYSDFQKLKDPQVIVATPSTMSHGLTMTAASTIVWAAPITNNDTFEQANARVSRPGQKLNQLIVMIEGSPIERKYYQRLKEKGRVQGILLQLVQASRKEAKV